MRLLILFVAILIATALAEAQSSLPLPSTGLPSLTAEQMEKLKERNKAFAEMKEHRAKGNLKEAIAAARGMLAIEKEVFGNVHADIAESLAMIAELHERVEDYSKAKTVADERLVVTIKLYGIEHWRTTDARLAADDLVLKERRSPADRVRLAEARQQSKEAVNLYRLGKYREATDATLNSLKLQKEILGDAHPDTLTSLNNLALLYQATSRYAEAEPLYREALAGCGKVFGDAHPDTLGSINNLANLYQATGRYSAAEPLYKEALTGYRKALGEAHLDILGSINNLANLYQVTGRFAEAEPLYKEALTGYRKALGEAHPDTLTNINNLALLYQATGRYAEAEPLYKEALAGRKKVLGDAHPDTLGSINNLALLYQATGRFAEAEPLYKDALAGHKKVLGDAHPSTVTSANNLAELYMRTNRYAEAEPLYKEALTRCHKALGKAHPDTLTSINNLAFLYKSTGRYAEAEPLYKEALTRYRKALGDAHPNTLRSVNNLAVLYDSTGRDAEAESLYKEALAGRTKTLGNAHPDTLGSINNLALLYQVTGRFAEAEPLYKEAMTGIIEHLEQTAAVQSEASQLAFAAKQRFYFTNFLSGTFKGAPSSTYALVFRWRGAVTARQVFARAARGVDPAAKTILEDLTTVTRRIATLSNNPPPPDKKVDVPALIKSLIEERDALEGKLAARSAVFAGYVKNRLLTPADLQKSLPDDSALVEYVEYKCKLAAFVVRKSSIIRVELGDTKPVSEAADTFRRTLDRVHPTTGKPDDPAVLLRKAIWEPLTAHLKGAKVVLICPEGPLCRIPLAALPAADPNKYLIEEVALAVVPVPRLLPELLANRPAKGDAPPTLLAVGDVDFDADLAAAAAGAAVEPAGWKRRRAGEARAWNRLPGTAGEVNDLEAAFRAAVRSGVPTVLRERAATEAAVRAAFGQHEYVHLATHGFFAAPTAAPPAMNLDRSEPMRDGPPRSTGPHPGLLSGLVLAGANKSTGEHDGVLTALEVGDLDLSKVEMAVLSACESGLGDVAAGEGVLGLQRAFQVAGARTTVTSLWKVDDDATRKLMGRFYEGYWKGNKGALEALRSAQLEMLEKGPPRGIEFKDETGLPDPRPKRTPPFYWAAFILSGDWR